MTIAILVFIVVLKSITKVEQIKNTLMKIPKIIARSQLKVQKAKLTKRTLIIYDLKSTNFNKKLKKIDN